MLYPLSYGHSICILLQLDRKYKIRQTMISMLPKFKFQIIFLFFISLSLISYFLFLPATVSAQSNTPPTTNVAENVPNNLHNWTQTVMIEVMSALTCNLVGVDPINFTQSCLGIDPTTNELGFNPINSDLKTIIESAWKWHSKI